MSIFSPPRGLFCTSFTEATYQSYCQNFYGDGWANFELSHWRGSVLLLLIEDFALFIKRSEDVPSHKGHLALVGGHRHPGEKDPLEVGLREFEEETGISANHVRPKGLMPPVFVASGELLIPVVGELTLEREQFQREIKSNGEWVVALAVSLRDLGQEDSWCYAQRFGRKANGPVLFRSLTEKDYWVVKSYAPSSNQQSLWGDNKYLLWGATARILWNYFQLLYRKA